MNKRIVGVFTNEHEASQAIGDLKSHGFRTEDISVIARNKDDMNAISDETGTKAPEGMASGAATGGLLGGVTGLLAGIGALAIPGIGPIIAAGPIAATLAGAAVGAGTGGLVGGLIGLGIPEDEAETYDRYVDQGRILVMVDADTSQVSDVYETFRTHNSLSSHYYGANDTLPGETVTDASMSDDPSAVDPTDDRADRSVGDSVDAVFNGSGLEGKHDTGLDTINSNPVSPTSADMAYNSPGTLSDPDNVTTPDYTQDVSDTLSADSDMEEDRKLRLREEQLNVSKDKVQTGEVSIHKEVVEEQKTINVPVTHEEVVIERRAVHDGSTTEPIGKDETIRIPVSEERVEVNKNTVVTGEVGIGKREVQGTERVQDTVRREEARVDKTGEAKVTGDKTADVKSRMEEDESMYNKR